MNLSSLLKMYREGVYEYRAYLELLDDPYDSLNLIKKHNGVWLCPMKKEHMHKDVPLDTLFAKMDPDSKDKKHLATALRALSDGIYSGN